ncbi:glycosyltransferase family 4 protein [Candidatus Peregrinibacteria bacterium]|nr:glycosyltransferase family 4 protein [Candidatus Peregrinibacteria bacterium]
MRILFISQFYPPEIGAASNRIGYFAKFLAKAGHEVSVLTSAPNYPEGKVYEGYKNRWTVQKDNGVTIYRTRIFLSTQKKTLARLAHYLSFIIASVIAKRKIPKPDFVVATSPPLFVGFIGVIFKKLWRSVRFILDIRDIWPESVESVGAVRSKILLRQGEKLARYIYRRADHITVTSPGIKKLIIHHSSFVIPPITILPNGAELDLFRPDISGDHVRRMWNIENKFVVLYTGNLGLAQAPEIFIKTAALLKEQHDIVFLIVGAGVLFQKLQNEATQKNLTNIIFTGARPRSEMPTFIASANVCVIPYKKADTFRNTFPSKMFDYMAGAKPIIINLKGEASELMEKAGCGLTAEEENAKDLAEKILLLKKNPAEADRLGTSGRAFVEKNYCREKIAEDLEKLLNNFL